MDRAGHTGYLIACLLAALLFVPGAYAQDWIYTAEELTLQLEISSGMSPSGTVNYVEASLNLFPRDDWRQDIVSISTDPSATKTDEYYGFRWDSPSGELPFSLTSTIKTRNDAGKVTNRVIFPLGTLVEFKDYMEATEYIDSSHPEVASLASELAEGKTDLYGIVSDMSHWVSDNIEYDSACGTFVAKASWTLSERRGTCDEYANLLIALCRALGIPARYVTGVAYSNLPDINGFGNHAWAEVYFPGHGWIPFDPTYGQHGYIDASHVKLQVSAISDKASVNYKWEGVGVRLGERELDIDTEVKDRSADVSPRVAVSVVPVHEDIGFGSYGIVTSEIRNLKNYYISAGMVFVTPQQVEVIGENKRNVWLKPLEKRTFFWVIKVNEGLDPGYVYTLPFMIHTERNVSATGEFTSDRDSIVYNKEDTDTYISARQEEEEKVYSKEVDLLCAVETVYTDEPESLNCVLKNRGNTVLEGISLCLKQSCETIRLEIGQEKIVSFPLLYSEEGTYSVTVTAKSNDISKSSTTQFEVTEKPEPKQEGFMDWLNSFFAWLGSLFG